MKRKFFCIYQIKNTFITILFFVNIMVKKYGILINSGKTNKIVESAKELVEQGYGDCEVIDRIEEKIKNIFN